jgi:hypothetical protein
LKQNLNRIRHFTGLFYVSWRGQNIKWHFVKNSKNLLPPNYSEKDLWKITLSKKFGYDFFCVPLPHFFVPSTALFSTAIFTEMALQNPTPYTLPLKRCKDLSPF